MNEINSLTLFEMKEPNIYYFINNRKAIYKIKKSIVFQIIFQEYTSKIKIK